MAWKSKDVAPSEVKAIDASLKQVEEQKKNCLFQLGAMYFEDNKNNENLDETYKKKVEVINKLDYNAKVWANRKLKLQGMRTCDGCGNQLPYESLFCNKCGAKLEAVAEELVIIQEQ